MAPVLDVLMQPRCFSRCVHWTGKLTLWTECTCFATSVGSQCECCSCLLYDTEIDQWSVYTPVVKKLLVMFKLLVKVCAIKRQGAKETPVLIVPFSVMWIRYLRALEEWSGLYDAVTRCAILRPEPVLVPVLLTVLLAVPKAPGPYSNSVPLWARECRLSYRCPRRTSHTAL